MSGERCGPDLVRTVLVVEDDPQVLDVVTRILRKGGYHAIPARDGREAWAIFQRAERPIDLVLTDVVMPRMPAPSWRLA